MYSKALLSTGIAGRLSKKNRTGADRRSGVCVSITVELELFCEVKLIREPKSTNFHLKLAFLMLNWSLIEARSPDIALFSLAVHL